jgi:hypothetical protein
MHLFLYDIALKTRSFENVESTLKIAISVHFLYPSATFTDNCDTN